MRHAVAAGYAGLVLCLVAGCGGSAPAASPSPDPAAQALDSTWSSYRTSFIATTGQVTDPATRLTTSEGEAYALLRAVWMDDSTTFRSVWGWTRAHLQEADTHLFGWEWGTLPGGGVGLVSTNTASDADEDIALALVFAGKEWRGTTYLTQARSVLQGIWTTDVGWLGTTPYLTAGNWAAAPADGQLVLNPSYLSPAWYRIFAIADPGRPWTKLVVSSYAALNACSEAPLGATTSADLPPNWCVLSAEGATSDSQEASGDDYGYDAFRVMWRVALDAAWFHSTAAHAYLLASGAALRAQWKSEQWLPFSLQHDGEVTPGAGQDPTTYGGDIGAFISIDPTGAQAIVQQVLLPSLGSDQGRSFFQDQNNYYEQNWVWFGLALFDGRLPDLAA